MRKAVICFFVVSFSGLFISVTALGDGVDCTGCNVSSIHLVERPRNLYPTVALGANLSVTFTFTGSCSSSPDVVWAKTTSIEKNTTPARRLPGNETRYVATLRIVHASNKSYGVYGAYVCGKQLINFTVVYPSLDCKAKPLPQSITSPIVVPNWRTKTVEMECHFLGDSSLNNYRDFWNQSIVLLHKGRKYNISRNEIETCSYVSTLSIHDVTSTDTGNYSCYAWPFARQETIRFDSLTTQLYVIDFPEIADSPHNTQITLSNSLALTWQLTGSHVIPVVYVDAKPLSNKTNLTIRMSGNISPNEFTVTLEIPAGALPAGRHSVQLLAFLDSRIVSDTADYNKKPNVSSLTFITVSNTGPEDGVTGILKVALPSVLGGLLVLLLICAIVAVILIHRKRRRRRGYEPLEPNHHVQATLHGSGIVNGECVEKDEPLRKPLEVVIIYCKEMFEQVLQLADYLNLMSTDRNGRQLFRCNFDGYHIAEHVNNWNNKIINWVKNSDYILLILTPKLYRYLTQSHDQLIEMQIGCVSSSALTNLISGAASGSRSFIPVFLNTAADRRMIPLSLCSNAGYEIHMENLNPDDDVEQQLEYQRSHQDEMDGLVNLLKLLRREV